LEVILASIAYIGKFRLLASVETLVKIKTGKTLGGRRECIHQPLLGKDENAFIHPLLVKDENAFTKRFTERIPSKSYGAMELT
jgi:hypothetical protein